MISKLKFVISTSNLSADQKSELLDISEALPVSFQETMASFLQEQPDYITTLLNLISSEKQAFASKDPKAIEKAFSTQMAALEKLT
jgi:hypothetical protein